MLNNFPVELGKKDVARKPNRDNLFNLGTGAKLDSKISEIFHVFLAEGLFLCKRARPIIQQAILVLCTRVKDPSSRLGKADESVEIFERHQDLNLTLSTDDLRVAKWYVDASFAVHLDFKSHTFTVMMLGKGAMQSTARK
jgi:hypothetical protein